MDKLKEALKKISDKGIGGVLLAGLLFVLLIALVFAIVAVCVGIGWGVGAGVIYYGLMLVGKVITYKMAYGLAMLLSVVSGVFGGIKVVNSK